MHFLKKIVENPILEDPPKKFQAIHRHYYRYSRGEFIGPALKVSQTKSKITLRGTHEYEDLIQEIVARTIPDEDLEIKGVLITGSDISDSLSKLGLNWSLKKSTGDTMNYKAEIIDQISKENLVKSIEFFRENSYFLISFNLNPTCKVSTKKRIPQPSKKKIGEDDLSKRVQFCTGIISNSEKNIGLVMDNGLPDFKSELPKKWKNIRISNNYKINEIVLPKDIKDSRLLRLLAIRKGILVRSVEIDGDSIEKQYSIVV